MGHQHSTKQVNPLSLTYQIKDVLLFLDSRLRINLLIHFNDGKPVSLSDQTSMSKLFRFGFHSLFNTKTCCLYNTKYLFIWTRTCQRIFWLQLLNFELHRSVLLKWNKCFTYICGAHSLDSVQDNILGWHLTCTTWLLVALLWMSCVRIFHRILLEIGSYSSRWYLM